jgi:uncharacterized protein YukE
MMKRPFVISALSITLILSNAAVFAQSEEHYHQTPESSLKLNDGQKWPADKHTDDSVQVMESTLKKFQAESGLKYQNLGKELEEQLKKLIAGCTMKGEAHTQLHLFIEQLNSPLKELNEGKDVNVQKEALNKTGKKLEEFHHFFEYLPKK